LDEPRLFPDKSAAKAWQRKTIHGPTNYSGGGQQLVEVRWLDEYQGEPYRGRLFRDHLPLAEVIDNPRPISEDAIIEAAQEDRQAMATCDLARDWDWASIEADAARRQGHALRSRTIENLPRQLLKLVYDVEGALRHRHPDLPPDAVADFFSSWRVRTHLD
jgi:hypothetical protein